MIEQEKNEQINSSEISPKQSDRVEIAERPLLTSAPKGAGGGKDGKIEGIKEKIKEIGEDGKQSGRFSDKKIFDIKTMEDLLAIKETADKLKALLDLAQKGRKEETRALEWAREIWEDSENATLLDELRDKLAEK